jgi:NADPH:quinone reductase-like Zn-dependent oxidoreductase
LADDRGANRGRVDVEDLDNAKAFVHNLESKGASMATMKAAVCTRYGSPEVLEVVEREKPAPRENEILIRICAASVTNSDIFIRSSRVAWPMLIPMRIMMGIRKPRNEILGEVLSGVVEAIGARITRFHVGDHVYGLTGFSLGAYAEYKCMKEADSKQGCLAIKPRNLSFEEATSAAYGGLLAFQILEEVAVQPNQKVLIYGASGTSGTIAVQLAKYLKAEVTAVCGPRNISLAKKLGADKTLDYTNASETVRLENYDLVVDCVGKARSSALKEACRKALARGGKYISIDDTALLLSSPRLDRIRELVEQGRIVAVSDRSFSLDQIVEAHKYVELGHKRGNVAITVSRAG